MRLPGLAELAESSPESVNADSRQTIIARFEKLIQELDEFAETSTLFETDTTHPNHLTTWFSSDSHIGNAYSFRTWRSTNLYCTWAMIRLYALLELQRLYLINVPGTPNESTIPESRCHTKIEAEIEQNLDHVCRGIPAQIGVQPHSLGMICSLLMLPTTASLLSSRGRIAEARWCNDVLEWLKHLGFR